MHLGTKNNGHEYYMLDESGHLTLDKITEEKDLGVWISNSLKSEKTMSRSSEQSNFGSEAIETLISAFRQQMLFDALQNLRPCTP